MGVPVPLEAARGILEEQREWEKKRQQRSQKDYVRARNRQKKAKKARHEREKQYMEGLCSLGHAVGEYVGGGQGDLEPEDPDDDAEIAGDASDTDDADEIAPEESSEQAHPLLFIYDCEATGLSIYDDHITEIAAKVVGVPVSSVSQPSFSSLVHTPRKIPKKVSEKTGINAALLCHEKPLSAVLPEFLKWVSITTEEVAERAGAPHYPVMVAHNGFRYDFPLLLAEIEQRPKELSTISHRLHFLDTLPHLRQAVIRHSKMCASLAWKACTAIFSLTESIQLIGPCQTLKPWKRCS